VELPRNNTHKFRLGSVRLGSALTARQVLGSDALLDGSWGDTVLLDGSCGDTVLLDDS
jgi:hypothetical protein